MRSVILGFLFSVAVLAQVPVIQTNDPLPEALAGSPYTLVLSATGTPSSWAITAGSLTACGVSLNTSSGVISGTPTAALCSITVTANNGSGPGANATFKLAVFSTPICAQASGNWTCQDAHAVYGSLTADEAARLNGRALWPVFLGPTFSCGATVTLAAGGVYTSYAQSIPGIDLAVSYRLFGQTGCGSGVKTRVQSTGYSSLNWMGGYGWKTLSVANKQAYLVNMAQMVSPYPNQDSNTTIQGYGTPNNYSFGGIAILTAPATFPAPVTSCSPKCAAAWAVGPPVSDNSMTSAQLPNNIELDHCFIGSSEEFMLGMTQDWYRADGNAQADINTWAYHFHENSNGAELEGDNIWVHDSIIEAEGADPTYNAAEISCDSGTNSNPAKVHCAGIAAAFGITAQAACYPSGFSSPPSFSSANSFCHGNGGTAHAVFTGARGGWGTTATDGSGIGKLNGAKLVVPVSNGSGGTDPDNVWVFEGWIPYSYWGNGMPLDSTSWGSLSGTVQIKTMELTGATFTAAVSAERGGNGVKFENNFVAHNGYGLFMGGGMVADDNRCDVQTGSTWNSLICVMRTGSVTPQIGDWLFYTTAAHPSRSNNCPVPLSGVPCSDGGGLFRVGQVTSVTGTAPNITIGLTGAGVGLNATDSGATPDVSTGSCPPGTSAPVTCGPARYRGRYDRYWKFTGNTVYRSPVIYGKGFIECKECGDSLFSGNYFLGGPQGDAFFTIHLQGQDPWGTANNSEWSYNVFGDPDYNTGGTWSGPWVGFDSESSQGNTANVRIHDNVIPDIAKRLSAVGIISGTNTRVHHNTYLAKCPTCVGVLTNQNNACNNLVDLRPYYTSPGLSIDSNILSFGQGFGSTVGICDSLPTGINRNIILNEQSVSPMPSWVGAQGNTVVAGKSNVGFTGSCDTATFANWKNCGLDPSSPYKGSMSDGSDPGADVLAVNDALNRWSEKAGLRIYSQSGATMINNPAAFSLLTTSTTVSFNIANALGSCSAFLYTDPARVTLHGDTNGGPQQACNRTGNSYAAPLVGFAFGNNVPLTIGTPYYYKIIDGADTMVGSFTTAAGCGISPSSLGPWTVGQVISTTLVTGGCGASTWSSSGTWPTGLTFNTSTGVLSGTITSAVGSPFTPSVSYDTATNTYSIVVNVAATITTSSPLPSVIQAAVYNQTLATSGGTGTVTFAITSGTLSGSGLTLNSAGLISGTAATPATYSFTVTPIDSNAEPGTPKGFNLTVGSASPVHSRLTGTKLTGVKLQ